MNNELDEVVVQDVSDEALELAAGLALLLGADTPLDVGVHEKSLSNDRSMFVQIFSGVSQQKEFFLERPLGRLGTSAKSPFQP